MSSPPFLFEDLLINVDSDKGFQLLERVVVMIILIHWKTVTLDNSTLECLVGVSYLNSDVISREKQHILQKW